MDIKLIMMVLFFFPGIGDIKVIDLTVSQIRGYIYNYLKEGGFLLEPFVDVKLVNAYFTILGEVSRPGKYQFLKNNMNIIEAFGIAGDLTINGERNDIKLIREIEGNKKVVTIDMTSKDLFDSDYFQIFSGDIIIVNQNSSRVKNAGVIGNSGTLLSLLSFLLSSIIIISN